MKNAYIATIALAVATLAAGQAMAADNAAPKTREQVQAELRDAQRNNTFDQKEVVIGLTYGELSAAVKPAAATTGANVVAAAHTNGPGKVSYTE